MRRTPVSVREMARLGWSRIDRTGSKCGARWRHVDGCTLEHCGHPTALYPWMLKTPGGELILHGAACPPAYNPDFGRCWATLRDAAAYVVSSRAARLLRRG